MKLCGLYPRAYTGRGKKGRPPPLELRATKLFKSETMKSEEHKKLVFFLLVLFTGEISNVL